MIASGRGGPQRDRNPDQRSENHRRMLQHDSRGREADERRLLHDAVRAGRQRRLRRRIPGRRGPLGCFRRGRTGRALTPRSRRWPPATTSSVPRIRAWCNSSSATVRCMGSITASIPPSLPTHRAGTTACPLTPANSGRTGSPRNPPFLLGRPCCAPCPCSSPVCE